MPARWAQAARLDGDIESWRARFLTGLARVCLAGGFGGVNLEFILGLVAMAPFVIVTFGDLELWGDGAQGWRNALYGVERAHRAIERLLRPPVS